MALKELVSKRVLEEILGKLQKEGSWKVLVLDKLSTRIISACCKMSDVMSKGITLVEALDKSRQPLPHLEAIYIAVPNEENIKALINDYATPSRNMYKAAHIFFLETCPDSLFRTIEGSKLASKIATLKEAFMAFLPYESKVFTLDYPDAFKEFYSPAGSYGDLSKKIADQVATVCAMLGEYPVVRYRAGVAHLEDVAKAVQGGLDKFKRDKESLGKDPEKSKSQLIILDRGFDVVSPIVHELTYQAMVYDLLTVDNDVYEYCAETMGGDRRERKVILDENDPLWVELRHKHLADISKIVSDKIKEFAAKKNLKSPGEKDTVKDLARYIKRVPQYQKELSAYSLHINMVDEVNKIYRKGGATAIAEAGKVEQDLAMGTDAQGEPITEPLAKMTPIMFAENLTPLDKIRLIILYVLQEKGLGKDSLSKLFQHSKVPHDQRKIVTNLTHLGHKVLQEDSVSASREIRRKERTDQYVVSRWVPLLQDIAESAAEGRLDERYAPSIKGSVPRSAASASFSSSSIGEGSVGATGTGPPGASVRKRWNWIPGPGQEGQGRDRARTTASPPRKNGPTIILFIVGGMTYSEMRAVYEASETTNCEVIIGSTHISTPTVFMDQLKSLTS